MTAPTLAQLAHLVDQGMIADRRRFHASLRSLRQAQHQRRDLAQGLAKLYQAIERSIARREARSAALPKVTYPPELPISQRRDEIMSAITQHRVVIVCGDTGSGKSTQLPKMCLQMGRGVAGLIGHTQPRRIAARTIASRIADELASPLGKQVGYQVRFEEKLDPSAYIKVMTDGILLAEVPHDRSLLRYDTLIIDEAHERSLNVDFLLGYLKTLLPRRPDLKIIITSATIDPDRFSRYFNQAPVIEVSGRMYPVQTVYRPLPMESDDDQAVDLVGRIVQTLGEIDRGELKYEESGQVVEWSSGQVTESKIRPHPNPLPEGEGTESGQVNEAQATTASHALSLSVADKDKDGLIEEKNPELGGPSSGVANQQQVAATSFAHDMLVFLPGEREIRESAEALTGAFGQRIEVLPLYARLAMAQQQRIFKPSTGNKRRVILATNVAETSLTVPNIGFVIDTGLARQSRYNPRTKVQRLPIEPIAQSSADQRKGRCGRVAPGVCVRLYDEADYASRPAFTQPEILRTNLASVILQMKHVGLGEPEQFAFIEPPSFRMIQDGYQTLMELGALDAKNELSPIGRQLARLPVDPRIGRMIVAGLEEGCLKEVLVIAAALSVQDPRDRPMDQQEAADRAHGSFKHESSDFFTWLKLWDLYHQKSAHLSRAKLREWCHGKFLSFVRMREWVDVHAELRGLMEEESGRVAKWSSGQVQDTPSPRPSPGGRGGRSGSLQYKTNSTTRPHDHLTTGSPDAIHRAVLTGLLANVGMRTEDGDYVGPRGAKFRIHPGSTLFGQKPPQWIMAGEIVQTTKLYARTVAAVRPTWIEKLAKHLVGRDYFKPFWDQRSARVLGFEKVMLHGLVVEPGRQVPFGKVNPQASREVFIHQGLVQGKYQSDAAFLQHNHELMKQVQRWEHKLRKPMLAGEEKRFAFYQERIPGDVYSGLAFETWRKKVERTHPRLLYMGMTQVLIDPTTTLDTTAYPEVLEVSGLKLALAYRHDLGNEADGVTVIVPLVALAQLPGSGGAMDRLVPGLWGEKVEALIRGLPKTWRTSFVPAPPYVQGCVERLRTLGDDRKDQSLAVLLSEWLEEMTGVRVPMEVFAEVKLSGHLAMRYQVVDEAGRFLEAGRDLKGLQERWGDRAAASLIALAGKEYQRDGIDRWDFGDLQPSVSVRCGTSEVKAYPAVLDGGKSVSLRLLPTPAQADQAIRSGVRRLFWMELKNDLERLQRQQMDPGWQQLAVMVAPMRSAEALKEDLWLTLVDEVMLEDQPGGPMVRTHEEFEVRLRAGWVALEPGMKRLMQLVRATLEARQEYALLMERNKPVKPAWGPSVLDMEEQYRQLLPEGFLRKTPSPWRYHLPRYLKGLAVRLRKLGAGGLQRDEQAMDQLRPWWELCWQRMRETEGKGVVNQGLVDFRWWVEECRVALFAQELKTAMPMSIARLSKKWNEVVEWSSGRVVK